jgi:hypothetical protein
MFNRTVPGQAHPALSLRQDHPSGGLLRPRQDRTCGITPRVEPGWSARTGLSDLKVAKHKAAA